MEYPDHPYEEIRKAAVDILARRWKPNVPDGFKTPIQYNQLKEAVGNLLNFNEVRYGHLPSYQSNISDEDSDAFLEVFWDLFRQGVITLGINNNNKEFPFFRVSSFGKKIIENEDLYFFHDVLSYMTLIHEQIPNIDDITLMYLKEATRSFYSDCYLSSSVMLGVASEHTFLKILETADNSKNCSLAQKAIREKNISEKFKIFKNKLDQEIGDGIINLDKEISENLDCNLEGIMNNVRRIRNDSGHPTGKEVSREQCYVNLNLFIPYCKTAYQLMYYFLKDN
jgi:hypothetical protein